MLVTIYTDASFHLENQTSSGAAWIRSSRGLIKESWSFTAKDSTEAEIIAISRAIKLSIKTWDNARVLFINTDSLFVCRYMWPFAEQKMTKNQEYMLNQINRAAKKRNLILRFKWVKAHQSSSKSGRAWLNNWCDKQAKEARKKLERSRKKGK